MKSICVYLGAKFGNSSDFKDSVTLLGKQIANSNLRLIYGGSGLGLRGELASTVVDYGGTVTGITTRRLMDSEQALTSLDELIITATMQERKIMMQEKADAFIVMPGGLGTLEEAFETWNAIKIGVLNKPLGFLNINRYFDGLFSFISKGETEGFISEMQVKIPKINSNSQLLIAELLKSNLLGSESCAG
jgi:uncharacterized protein (TIGR00730 family)